MRTASKLVALRGSLAASRGDVKSALEDSRKMFVIANHTAMEGTAIGLMIREGLQREGIRQLGYWAL